MLVKLLEQSRYDLATFWLRLGDRSTKRIWTFLQRQKQSMQCWNSFQLLCTCKNPVVLTVKACRLGIRQENFFNYRYPISKGKRGGGGILTISIKNIIWIILQMFCFGEFYFIGTLTSPITLQQEISAMVKQKCLYKVLLHRISDIFYFSATRYQCNGETEISF